MDIPSSTMEDGLSLIGFRLTQNLQMKLPASPSVDMHSLVPTDNNLIGYFITAHQMLLHPQNVNERLTAFT